MVYKYSPHTRGPTRLTTHQAISYSMSCCAGAPILMYATTRRRRLLMRYPRHDQHLFWGQFFEVGGLMPDSPLDPTTQRLINFQPDVVPGEPLYLYGPQYPGGRIINYDAFSTPPAGVEGDAGRNSARGFDAVEADLALRRNFTIREHVKLEFRAEAFNVANHPIFGTVYNDLAYGKSLFGYAAQTLSGSLGEGNSLYQVGGPRSLQMMLRLRF